MLISINVDGGAVYQNRLTACAMIALGFGEAVTQKNKNRLVLFY